MAALDGSLITLAETIALDELMGEQGFDNHILGYLRVGGMVSVVRSPEP